MSRSQIQATEELLSLDPYREPYREPVPTASDEFLRREADRERMDDFARHIFAARFFLDDCTMTSRRATDFISRVVEFTTTHDVRVPFEPTLLRLRDAAHASWTSCWAQLDRARTIASDYGHDLAEFDAVRRDAGDPDNSDPDFVVSSEVKNTDGRVTVTVTWRGAPSSCARDAIDTLLRLSWTVFVDPFGSRAG